MTRPDELRGRLIDALAESIGSGWSGIPDREDLAEIADALLPLVEDYIRQRRRFPFTGALKGAEPDLSERADDYLRESLECEIDREMRDEETS